LNDGGKRRPDVEAAWGGELESKGELRPQFGNQPAAHRGGPGWNYYGKKGGERNVVQPTKNIADLPEKDNPT